MNAVSGLRSVIRCRNGAKSGLASGNRIDSIISPPTCLKRVVKATSASMPGAQSLTSVTTRLLLAFLNAHSAKIHDCGGSRNPARTKYGDFAVVIEAPELMTSATFLASVTIGAIDRAVGVIPMPQISTLSL